MHSLRMEFGVFQTRFTAVVAVAAALSLTGALAHSERQHFDFRLPTDFIPISYSLKIITHLENEFRFEGVVNIKMSCVRATDTVVLHAAELDVDVRRVRVDTAAGDHVPVNSVLVVPSAELVRVHTDGELKVGHVYVLTVPFAGNITDQLVGYYRSSYVDAATKRTRWLAVTKFEPADARRAFPCFDEPVLKAKFKISLGHKKHLTAVSNMPLKRTSPLPSHPDYVLDEFQESVPMSTYLVAYMVSDLAHVESDSRHGDVKFRILARKDAVYQTELARRVGPLASKYFEDYFDEKYSLPKQDMVALPDFSSGAMENWGLITYRETALLIDPKVATIENVHRVVEIITHELAHQWFGNLVTMKWWSDLWLNEGFATYVTARGVDFLYPEWNSLQTETVKNFLTVLDLDSLQSSHPVSMKVGHTQEIAQIFDVISYTKGSYLLHMMNAFLGEKTFKKGIRKYIHKYKYSNAAQDDLWSTMTDVAHREGSLNKSITVKEIMDTWTLQTGYPVVIVNREIPSFTVTITQKRFLSSKSISADRNSCWWVPLTMTFSTEPNFNKTKADMWLTCKNDRLSFPLEDSVEWVILNVQMAGLYRVLYDGRNLIGIIKTLNDPDQYKKIHTMNRVQLIDDALTFAFSGDLDYGFAFEILKYLRHEKEYTPWLAALNGLGPIGKVMRNGPDRLIYLAYMQRLLLPVFNRTSDMTVELKGFEEIQLRNLIMNSACRHLIKECIDQALELFRKWMKTADPDRNDMLPKELKSTIYCYAIKYGEEEEWNFLWKRYEKSNVATEKATILSALGCSSKILVLVKYLNWTIGENAVIRKQDAISVFYAVAANDFGFLPAKDFLFNNIKEISNYFYPQNNRVGLYIKAIGSHMKTEAEFKEIQKFIKKSSVYLKGAEMAAKQAIETVRIKTEWMSKFYKRITRLMEL